MINSLTDENEKMIEIYKNKWIEKSFDTNNISDDEIKKIIKNIYTVILKKSIPEKILIMDSPFAIWQDIQKIIGKPIRFVSPFFNGHLDTYIFAFYDYFINELHVKIPEQIMEMYNIWREISQIGSVFPYDDVCYVSRKPILYKMKNKVIHCEDGPAIQYRDGFAVYALNGVRMKKEYIMTPWNKLNPQVILKEKNAEVRRELVRKIGIERIIEKLGAKIIESRDDYELLSIDVGDGRNRPYLKMKNPSIGVYHIEGVHPDCKTIDEALKFRNGTEEKPIIIT